jgi:porphobilinogen deaminase
MWHDRRLHAEDARIRSDFAAADASVRGESAVGDASIRRDFNTNDAAIRNEVNQLRGDYDASVKAIQKENEKEFKKLRTEDRKIASVSTALASLELDPTRDGFSMGVALGVADFANGSDEIGEAVGLMYGKDDKAVNFKYGRSGSYSAAGVGITVGF